MPPTIVSLLQIGVIVWPYNNLVQDLVFLKRIVSTMSAQTCFEANIGGTIKMLALQTTLRLAPSLLRLSATLFCSLKMCLTGALSRVCIKYLHSKRMLVYKGLSCMSMLMTSIESILISSGVRLFSWASCSYLLDDMTM